MKYFQKRVLFSLLLFFFYSNSFGQTGMDSASYFPGYKLWQDSASFIKRGYKLDTTSKWEKWEKVYFRHDSIFMIDYSGFTARVFSKSEFEGYLKFANKVRNTRARVNESYKRLSTTPIPHKLKYTRFIGYVEEYIDKLDSLNTIHHLQLYNCMTLSNIIDEQIFLKKENVTPLMQNYKIKFDSLFSIECRRRENEYEGRYLSVRDHDALFTRAVARYYEKGYKNDGKKFSDMSYEEGQALIDEMKNDMKEFYKTCPLKYELLQRERPPFWISVSLSASPHPIFFFIEEYGYTLQD